MHFSLIQNEWQKKTRFSKLKSSNFWKWPYFVFFFFFAIEKDNGLSSSLPLKREGKTEERDPGNEVEQGLLSYNDGCVVLCHR